MAAAKRAKMLICLLAISGTLAPGIWYFAIKEYPVPVGQPTAAPQGPEWEDLLSGDSVRAWRNITDESEIFEIQGDALHIPGNSVYPLRYVAWGDERLGDFELHLEYKVASDANSGVFLRAQPNDPVYRGFEVQVLDDHGDPPNKNGSGAIYDVVTPMFNLARPAGEWNSYDIVVRGTSIVVTMNGWKVIDTDLALMTTPLGKFSVAYADLPREGLLMLQDHGGEVWYRNIRLKRL